MKRLQVLTLIFAGLFLSQPIRATVQPNAEAAETSFTGAANAAFEKKAFRDFARARKNEQKVQLRAERYWRNAPAEALRPDNSVEQIFAAVLCFFLGTIGIHRVYLKAKPILILWYLISFGGFFGLIPLIDFIRLIMGQTDHYRGNSNLFRAFQ